MLVLKRYASRSVSTVEDLNDWFRPWLDQLTEQEVQALRWWQTSESDGWVAGKRPYEAVNSYLRTGELPDATETELDMISDAADSLQRSVIKGAGFLREDVVAYRVVSNWSQLADGQTHPVGFSAFSLSMEEALKFANLPNTEDPCLITAVIESETPCAWVAMATGRLPGQQEILLGLNLSMQFENKATRDAGLWRVEAVCR